MFVPHEKNAGQNHNLKTANKSFENVVNFKGMTQTDQNSMNEETESSSNSENAYYHSVQNLLSFDFLSGYLE